MKIYVLPVKDLVKTMKGKVTHWEKTYAIYVSKGILSTIYIKKSKNSAGKKNLTRKWAKDINSISPKGTYTYMANDHVKRCSISTITEMKIITTVRYHYTPVRMD